MMDDGHANTYVLKLKGRNLTLAPLPRPTPFKIKMGNRRKKNLYLSETRVEGAISKSKPLFTLLMVESNTR